jgi:hypothetical protein
MTISDIFVRLCVEKGVGFCFQIRWFISFANQYSLSLCNRVVAGCYESSMIRREEQDRKIVKVMIRTTTTTEYNWKEVKERSNKRKATFHKRMILMERAMRQIRVRSLADCRSCRSRRSIHPERGYREHKSSVTETLRNSTNKDMVSTLRCLSRAHLHFISIMSCLLGRRHAHRGPVGETR